MEGGGGTSGPAITNQKSIHRGGGGGARERKATDVNRKRLERPQQRVKEHLVKNRVLIRVLQACNYFNYTFINEMPKNINQKEKKKTVKIKRIQRIGKKDRNCHILKDGTREYKSHPTNN